MFGRQISHPKHCCSLTSFDDTSNNIDNSDLCPGIRTSLGGTGMKVSCCNVVVFLLFLWFSSTSGSGLKKNVL